MFQTIPIIQKTILENMDLSFKLEELFMTKADLITEESLKGNFKNIILSEVIPFEIMV